MIWKCYMNRLSHLAVFETLSMALRCTALSATARVAARRKGTAGEPRGAIMDARRSFSLPSNQGLTKSHRRWMGVEAPITFWRKW